MTDKDTMLKEAIEAATDVAKERMLALLANMLTYTVDKRTDNIRNEVVDTHIGSFTQVVKQNIMSVDMDEDEREEVLEGLGMMRDELETLASMSFVTALAAVHTGLVPFGTAGPNELDMIDMYDILSEEEGSRLERYIAATRQRLSDSGASTVLTQLSAKIAESIVEEGEDQEPLELVLLGIVNYILIVDSVRAYRRGLPAETINGGLMQAIMDLYVDEIKDSGFANGPVA